MTFVYYYVFGRRALRVFRGSGQVARGEYVKTNFSMKINAKPQRSDRPSSAVATQLYVSMLCSVLIAYYIPLLLYRTGRTAMLSHIYVDVLLLLLLLQYCM